MKFAIINLKRECARHISLDGISTPTFKLVKPSSTEVAGPITPPTISVPENLAKHIVLAMLDSNLPSTTKMILMVTIQ